MGRPAIWAIVALATASLGAATALPATATNAPRATTTNTSLSCTQTPIAIPNGGFEHSSLKPWIGSGSVSIVSGGYKSEHALEMSAINAGIRQRIPETCEVTAYTITFAYKILDSNSAQHCSLFIAAYYDKFYKFEKSIPLAPAGAGIWKIGGLEYLSNLQIGFTLEFDLSCNKRNTTATILLDDIQITSSGSIAGQGCPKVVELVNGGFDTGQFTPWTPDPNPIGNIPTYSVVAPGYHSSHAFEMDFPAATFTDWYFGQAFREMCDGSFYNISWAADWINYVAPTNPAVEGCAVSVYVDICGAVNDTGYSFPATTTPGWESHSYMCQSGANGKANIDADITCDSDVAIPAFTLRMDSFEIQLLDFPPAP